MEKKYKWVDFKEWNYLKDWMERRKKELPKYLKETNKQ